MTNKKHYYVTVDKQEIRDISIPDNGVEYKIIANQKEKEEIEELFRAKDKNEKDAVKFLAKPFDEWGADDKREDYDNKMIELYRKVYELGTSETKREINNLGLFN
ncbi:hypothetical protein QGM71_04240 [Virgibacillus sp. C22-A2]|uniref:Hydrolase n=1 Tax=Virgibacillus tibetensis TaxID=3042313 RepID=A0ABU6KE38_9BACI|nr:hypothetical protein [Virgibacillus sp. C22-A2]